MNLRILGLVSTFLAVGVLLGSLLLGLGGAPADGMWETSAVTRTEAPLRRIRVEVLNGAGIPGLAREVTDRLRARGYDVVYLGNASGSLLRDSTVVLDRGRDAEAVARVAAELEIPRIELAVDTSLYLEATVILGRDWKEIEGERR